MMNTGLYLVCLIALLLLLLLLLLIIIIWQIFAYKVDEAKYVVLKSDKSIEIRQYPALILAEVKIKGKRYSAINTGFRALAKYIFGKNQSNQKIAMTAPVMQENISAPSTAHQPQQIKDDIWQIRFVMPEKFTMASLPIPNNHSVMLYSTQPKKYIVIRFSGANTDKNLQEHRQILFDYINKNKLITVGNAIAAYYNPPWILPFLRRNEIMVELKE
jgi:hypothetical protein